MTRQSAANLRKLNSHLVHLALEVEAKLNSNRKEGEFDLNLDQQNQQAKRLNPPRQSKQKARMNRLIQLPCDVDDSVVALGVPTDQISALVFLARELTEMPVITTSRRHRNVDWIPGLA